MAEYLPAQLETVKKQPQTEFEAPTKKERAPAPHPLISLQSRAGNQAVARMVQREAAEEELQAKHDTSIQREAAEEELQARHDTAIQREAPEEELQAKHDPSIQRESEGGEAEEEEPIQAKHDTSLQRESEGGEAEEEEPIQAKHDAALQRVGEEDEMVQAKHDTAPQVGLEGGAVGGDIESRINGMRGGGSPAPDGLRRQMEAATGSNLSGVRVHQGAESDTLNKQLTAKAFTTGSDIFLRGDQSTSDSSLMAHEMAHVVQQSSGRTAAGGSGMTAGAANDPLEAEADNLAHAVLSGTAQRHSEEDHG